MKKYFYTGLLVLLQSVACSSSSKSTSPQGETDAGGVPVVEESASAVADVLQTQASKAAEVPAVKKEECNHGFKKANDKCTRICPKGKVYDGGVCKTCEQTVGKTLWLTEDFLDVYTETPMERNVCGNDDGCTLSEKEVKAKDGEIVCVAKKRDESFCNSLAQKIKAKASWAGADMLKDFKVGRCEGAKLVELANAYRKNFDSEVKLAVQKCKTEKTFEAPVYIPPSMDINAVMQKNCYPLKRDAESGKEFRDELKELFMDVRSIPVYSGLID